MAAASSGTRVQLSPEWADDAWFRFPRSFIRDPQLSFKAKGVAALLASHSEAFRFSADEITKWGKEGRDGVRSALIELEKAGYLMRVREVDETGKARGMVYELYPFPQVKPQTGFPATADPATADPATENPADPYKKSTPKEYHSQEEHHEEKTSADESAGALFDVPEPEKAKTPQELLDEDFDVWWELYPKKVGKGQARTAYRAARRRGVDRVELIDAARPLKPLYAKLTKDRQQFMVHPSTYLNGERYLEDARQVVPRPDPDGVPPVNAHFEPWTEEKYAANEAAGAAPRAPGYQRPADARPPKRSDVVNGRIVEPVTVYEQPKKMF